MRFIVLLFGLFGVLLTAAGAIALLEWDTVLVNLAPYVSDIGQYPTDPTSVSTGNAALFAFVVTLYGLFGVVLAFFRCGKQGGALILVSLCMAVLVNPYLLPFVALLGFTGLIALFVGPLPINAPATKKPAKKTNDDDDDD
jgi:hypothetical protein